MIDLGYDDSNTFTALKTVSLVLCIYFVRVILSIFIYLIIIKMNHCKFRDWLIKIHGFIAWDVFFNLFIGLSLEAYIEFFIFGMMNMFNPEF